VLLNGDQVGLSEVDVLFIPDCTSEVPAEEIYREKEKRKLPVVSIIYDVLPITHPHYFPSNQSNLAFRINLQKQLAISDEIICISEATKQAVLNLNWKFDGKIHASHLGALPIQNEIARLELPHTLICVGTIEPRKGHRDLIDAFDFLSKSIPNLVLIIAGRLGWGSDSIATRIVNHPEFNKRLKWFDSPNEEQLEILYSLSSLAIVPTHAEGYGLNIEEALNRSVKVLARDLQVFRERKNKNLYFFSGNGEDLALAIAEHIYLEFEQEEIRQFMDFSREVIDRILHCLPREMEFTKK
jgi:glycosyltransferase involved in cell wall biosynthesis